MNKRRLKKSNCPGCGKKIDACTHALGPDKPPKPGDFSLCGYCGEILIFNPDLTVRNPVLIELLSLPPPISHLLNQLQTKIRRDRPLPL